MAVSNDYSRYFFNNLYDEELITDKLSSLQNHMYDPIIRGKAWIQNNRVINGDILDIQVNQSLNLRFGMPMNTYSIFLNINIIPFYSEKEFYFKYGYEKPITITQIMEDDKTFSKYIYFFMDGYLIHDVELVVLKGGHTIVFIHPTEDDKKGNINENDLKSILYDDEGDGLWTILFSTRSDVYKARLPRASLFKDNKIYLSSFSQYKKYNKPTKNNCYTMYMSAFASSYNIMTACNVTVGKDSQGEYFLVPQKFKEFIYTKVNNIFCMIINEPECSGSGIYIDTLDGQPIFQIPYKKNPIPVNNLLVWRYDTDTCRKFHPIEVDVTISYPNIYDFNEMIDATYYEYLCEKSKSFIVDKNDEYFILSGKDEEKRCDLYIEWIEPMQDCMVFHSYIQDYIDYEPEYCEMVTNDELPIEFKKNFNPIKPVHLGAMDYYKSDFYGDYRGWQLDCLSQILHHNPKWYDDIYHTIYYSIREYFTRCYNVEKETEIYDRSILNNYDHCEGDKENRITFDIPHTYLHVHDHQETLQPMNLFIGGKLFNYTYEMKRGASTYIYFDKRYLAENESIQLDVELTNKRIENARIVFNATGSPVDLESLEFKDTHSLTNLLLYDNNGNYIDLENFSFTTQVKNSDIAYDGDKNIDSTLYESIDFYTADDEAFIPIDAEGLLLKEEEMEYEIEEPNSPKNVDLDNIIIKPNDPSYFGRNINVGTTDFFQKKSFILDSKVEETELSYDFIYRKFKGKPTNDRFKVYADGLLISTSMYTIEFTGYEKDAIFHFDKSLYGKKIDIHYVAYNDELVFDDEIGYFLKVEGANILFLRDILTTPYDKYVYKIYIDGYRISDDQIFLLNQSNMIYINRNYTKDSNIMIFKQKMDKEIYGYEKNTQFLDETAQKDPNFLQYLFDKYVVEESGI